MAAMSRGALRRGSGQALRRGSGQASLRTRQAQRDSYEVITLGFDEPIVLNDAIRLVEELIGKRAAIEYRPRHPADVLATWADSPSTRLRTRLAAAVSIKKGVAQLVAWCQANREWAKDVATW